MAKEPDPQLRRKLNIHRTGKRKPKQIPSENERKGNEKPKKEHGD